MTRRVAFRPQADAEVREARRWYEERRSGLGTKFAAAVEEAVAQITENPLAFPCVRGETRRAILHRFPYGLYFRVLRDEVIVLGVVHGRRHSRRWKSRSGGPRESG